MNINTKNRCMLRKTLLKMEKYLRLSSRVMSKEEIQKMIDECHEILNNKKKI